MSDKLEQIEKILTQIYISNGYNFEFSDAAQQILDICQPQWIEVTDESLDIEICRVIIGVYEQEMFYKCERGVWLRQGDNGVWIASAFIPSYYFIMPPPPEDKP